MKKSILTLALVSTLTFTGADAQNMQEHEHDHAPGIFHANEADYLNPDIIQSTYLTVKPMQMEKFDAKSREKLDAAFAVLEQVVNSEEFKDRVINFKNSKGERAFASNKGLTNEEIYETFMEGRETLQQNTPGEMNFFLKLYNRPWSRVIGYTTAKTNVININWKFFKNYKPSDVASNLAHEWVHKIGFDHTSAKEHDSAPYAIGYIVNDIAEKLQAKKELH